MAAALSQTERGAAASAAFKTQAHAQSAADRDRPGETQEDALKGIERWRTRHPDAAAHLEPADVLVDAMRGRYTTWTRTRINLEHVPESLRPPQEPLDPDEKMTSRS